MGERRTYEMASITERLLMHSRGRMTTRRNELVVGMRGAGGGNAYRPVSEGYTSPRPPFAVDPEDDPEFDYHPDEANNDRGEPYVDPELPDWQQRDLDEDPLENDPDDEDEDAN